jgi:diaminopimelate epimerase
VAVSRAKTATLVLSGEAGSETTLTALQLAERLTARGVRVTIYARDVAATVAAGSGELADAVGRLLRRGVHGATLDWVVDAGAAARFGVEHQVAGVIPGSCSDLWAFVRDADVILAPPGRTA